MDNVAEMQVARQDRHTDGWSSSLFVMSVHHHGGTVLIARLACHQKYPTVHDEPYQNQSTRDVLCMTPDRPPLRASRADHTGVSQLVSPWQGLGG